MIHVTTSATKVNQSGTHFMTSSVHLAPSRLTDGKFWNVSIMPACLQDERAEHLRGFSFLSGIVAGFIVASFLQVTFDPLQTSRGLQVAFAATVGLTVSQPDLSDIQCRSLTS